MKILQKLFVVFLTLVLASGKLIASDSDTEEEIVRSTSPVLTGASEDNTPFPNNLPEGILGQALEYASQDTITLLLVCKKWRKEACLRSEKKHSRFNIQTNFQARKVRAVKAIQEFVDVIYTEEESWRGLDRTLAAVYPYCDFIVRYTDQLHPEWKSIDFFNQRYKKYETLAKSFSEESSVEDMVDIFTELLLIARCRYYFGVFNAVTYNRPHSSYYEDAEVELAKDQSELIESKCKMALPEQCWDGSTGLPKNSVLNVDLFSAKLKSFASPLCKRLSPPPMIDIPQLSYDYSDMFIRRMDYFRKLTEEEELDQLAGLQYATKTSNPERRAIAYWGLAELHFKKERWQLASEAYEPCLEPLASVMAEKNKKLEALRAMLKKREDKFNISKDKDYSDFEYRNRPLTERIEKLIIETECLRKSYSAARAHLGECYWKLGEVDRVISTVIPLIEKVKKTFEDERDLERMVLEDCKDYRQRWALEGKIKKRYERDKKETEEILRRSVFYDSWENERNAYKLLFIALDAKAGFTSLIKFFENQPKKLETISGAWKFVPVIEFDSKVYFLVAKAYEQIGQVDNAKPLKKEAERLKGIEEASEIARLEREKRWAEMANERSSDNDYSQYSEEEESGSGSES